MSTYQDVFHIGKMRLTGVLQQNQPVDNASGGQDDNFVTILTTRGWLIKDSGNTNILYGDMVLTKRYTWYCRYQQAIITNVEAKWIIKGQLYCVDDFELVDEIKHIYKFTLKKDE